MHHKRASNTSWPVQPGKSPVPERSAGICRLLEISRYSAARNGTPGLRNEAGTAQRYTLNPRPYTADRQDTASESELSEPVCSSWLGQRGLGAPDSSADQLARAAQQKNRGAPYLSRRTRRAICLRRCGISFLRGCPWRTIEGLLTAFWTEMASGAPA